MKHVGQPFGFGLGEPETGSPAHCAMQPLQPFGFGFKDLCFGDNLRLVDVPRGSSGHHNGVLGLRPGSANVEGEWEDVAAGLPRELANGFGTEPLCVSTLPSRAGWEAVQAALKHGTKTKGAA